MKFKELVKLQGVISVGRTKEGIEVEVLKGSSPSLPKEVNGMKVIKVEVDKDYDEERTQKHRPLRPGIRLRGALTGGSLGLIFKHKGERYLMTAYHLFVADPERLKNPEKGRPAYQEPGSLMIGREGYINV